MSDYYVIRIPKNLSILFYVGNIILLYLYLIPFYGNNIRLKCLNNYKCSRYIRKSNLFAMDTADSQWNMLHDSFGLLFIVVMATLFIKMTLLIFTPNKNKRIAITYLRAIVNMILLFTLHRYHSIIILFICYLNYSISHTVRFTNKRDKLWIIWIFAISTLLFKESYRLLRNNAMSPLEPLFNQSYSGIYLWYYPTNFLVLRMLSYSIDNYSQSNDYLIKSQDTSFLTYFSYVCYSPLYIAGPIISYSDFIKDSNNISMFPKVEVLLYLIRWIFCFILLKYLLSLFPIFAVIKSEIFITQLSVAEIVIGSYILVKIMWLKFLVIWRFFRLWSMIDNINPPENMERCLSNNYSLESFWKGWHSSFNKWIVRYMYIPMGGNKNRFLSAWVIFMFVAMWHDLEFKLVLWGLLNSLFYIFEIIGQYIITKRPFINLPINIQNFMITASGAIYIMVLISVNMIGYAIGTAGFQIVIKKFLSISSIFVFIICFYFLFIGVSFMKFVRKFLNK